MEDYSTAKSLGSDHWRCAEIRSLSNIVMAEFSGVFTRAQASLTWPLQMLLVLESLLGKRGGGERGIGKTPMWYRAWSRWTAPAVKASESSTDFAWDTAKAGSSALLAARKGTYFRVGNTIFASSLCS